MGRASLLLVILAHFWFLGCVTAPLPKDHSIEAVKAQDATAPVEGCDQPLASGYVYCRKMEGQPSTDSLIFITPPVKCSKKSCAYIKIFSPSSDQILGIDVPRGQTRTVIAWKELLGREAFTLQDRGLWPFIYHIYFTDNDGFDHTLLMEGEIRLRVYTKDYFPLKNGQSDPSFAWEFIENGQQIKITTKGRVYIAPKNP